MSALPQTDTATTLREILRTNVQEQFGDGGYPPLRLPEHQSEESPMPGDLPAVRIAGESIDALREEIHNAARLAAKEAAAQVVGQLLTPERARELFLVFFAVLQEQLANGAGKWMLGGVWGALRKFFWLGLGLVALLIVGGPGLVKALLVTFWAHVSPKG